MLGQANLMQPESATLPKVGHLIVIAGPSCSGKSTLIAALQRGELPELQKALEIEDPLDWAYVHALGLPQLSGMYAEKLVLHYDFKAQQSPNGYRFLAGLLRNSDNAVFLTLQVKSEVLMKRNWSRLILVMGIFIRRPRDPLRLARRLRNLARRHLLYRNPHAVTDLYGRWFGFCSACGDHMHWVLDASGEKVGEVVRRV